MWIISTAFFVLSLIGAGFTNPHPPPQHPAAGDSKVSNSDIQQIMQQLWQLDSNRLLTGIDYQLDYQGAASQSSVHDHAPNP